MNSAKTIDLRERNRILVFAVETSGKILFLSSDVKFDWSDAVVVSITDASFQQETECFAKSDEMIEEDGRSQQAYMITLGPPTSLNDETSWVHPICWGSTVTTRVCRSTLQAETFALCKGTECGAKIRAVVVDARVELDVNN